MEQLILNFTGRNGKICTPFDENNPAHWLELAQIKAIVDKITQNLQNTVGEACRQEQEMENRYGKHGEQVYPVDWQELYAWGHYCERVLRDNAKVMRFFDLWRRVRSHSQQKQTREAM